MHKNYKSNSNHIRYQVCYEYEADCKGAYNKNTSQQSILYRRTCIITLILPHLNTQYSLKMIHCVDKLCMGLNLYKLRNQLLCC